MEDLRSHSGPMKPKLLVAALLVAGMGTTLYMFCNNDVHTPGYTNSLSLIFTILCNVGIVMGPAALFGLHSLNFRLYPKKFSYLFTQKSNALTYRVFASKSVNYLAVPLLCLGTLTLADSVDRCLVLPAIFWFALTMSSLFMHQQLLMVPLWLTKDFTKITAFAFLTTVSLSYRAIANEFEFT